MIHSISRSLFIYCLIPSFCFLAVDNQSVVFAQIVPDNTTATQVNGNAIAPVGAGTVNGENLYHSFDKLNVPQSGVIFNTGNSAVDGSKINNILNRVTGDTPSQILGTIESRTAFPNANLFLMNPNGVVFGKDARLDIGGSFHVTTGTGLGFAGDRAFSADKSTLDFPSGNPQNIRFAVSEPAAIINQGNLSVATGKNITFTAGAIVNSGILTAPSGNVALSSVSGGSLVDLRSPDLVLGLSVTKDAVPINWDGNISSIPKLAELLTGKVPEGDRVVVKPDGTLAIVATPAANEVPVTNGTTVVSGAIDVSSATTDGGKVGIFGDRVAVVNSLISATGINGGNVLIGGDLQGKGIAPNAQYTYFDNKSVVDVSALQTGNGGKAIVWGDRTTQFLGTLLSKGGSLSGDGGFVEVSGKENLLYRGNVNTSAINGNFGTLLLDPPNITIVTTGATDNIQLSAGVPNSSDPASVIFFNDVTSDFTIENSVLNSATSNIILQAPNDINVNAPINIAGANISFTAQSGNNINVNQNIQTNGGDISLLANNGTAASGTGSVIFATPTSTALTSNGGNIKIEGNLLLTTETKFLSSGIPTGGAINLQNANINGTQSLTLDSGTGAITLDSIGSTAKLSSLTVNGGSILANQAIATSGDLSFTTTGNITTQLLNTNNSTIGNAGNISIQSTNGNVAVSAIDASSASASFGNVTIQASGDINISATSGNPSIATFGNAGNGGAVLLISANGNVTSGSIVTQTFQGNAGNVTIQASGDINISDTSSTLPFGAIGAYIDTGGIGNGGAVSLTSTNGNITSGSILTNTPSRNGGNITLTSSNGAINVSSGKVDTSTGNGTAGSITFQSFGNIITGSGTTPNPAIASFIRSGTGTPNSITFTSTNGAIDTSRGDVDAGGGIITFNASGDITTSGVFSRAVNGGEIKLTSQSGAINTTAGDLTTTGTITGTGGNITLLANGNVATRGVFATGDNGTISITSTNGIVDTTLGAIVGGVSTSQSGNGGTVTIQSAGDILTGGIIASNLGIGNAASVFIESSGGKVQSTSISAFATGSTGNGGNVTINAGGNIQTTGTTTFSGNTYSIVTNASPSGIAGNISLSSTNGAIDVSSGAVSSASISGNGGNINFIAKNSITAADLNTSSDLASGGNIFLDPIGDIVLNSANTAGAFQGGNFTAISTGGNIRLLGLVSSPFATCAGASICSTSNTANTSGQISIRHGGINSFTIGDSSINGTAGIITTGSSTLALGTILPVGNSTFTQGNVTIFPYLIPIVPPQEPPVFDPPKQEPPVFDPTKVIFDVNPVINNVNPTISDNNGIDITDVMKKEVDRNFKEGDLPKAYDAIEKAYASELGIFLGETLTPSSLNMNEAQRLVSDVSKRSGSVSALIYPIMLDDRIEILVIPPKELGKPFHRYTKYTNKDEIINILTEYRDNLRDPSSQDYLVQAQKLYDWMMRPIDDQLQAMKVKTLVFVMDSSLRVIPPAALHDGKQFLIERYASANVPSLRVTRLEDRDRKNTRVLAMGLTEARGDLSALPSVEVEIRAIATQVLSGAIFLNQDFTVEKMQEERGKANYGILHLATHGQFLQDRAKDSYIQFWDSKLRSDQIPKLRFEQPVIDMLTLSACETAVGNNLGISGLAIESGARSILASLWTVSDVGTAPLMISFYKAFPNALSKATALRQAQLEVLKGKVKIENNQIVGIEGLAAIPLPKGDENVDLRHPFFWSSFILVGNWL